MNLRFWLGSAAVSAAPGGVSPTGTKRCSAGVFDETPNTAGATPALPAPSWFRVAMPGDETMETTDEPTPKDGERSCPGCASRRLVERNVTMHRLGVRRRRLRSPFLEWFMVTIHARKKV